jgi:hypothetical protein
MPTSAPAPPGNGNDPEGDELDDVEMTSIMNADQRRQLQQATRKGEVERATAPPPPEAAAAIEAARPEVAIPRAAAVPVEASPGPAPEPSPPEASPAPVPELAPEPVVTREPVVAGAAAPVRAPASPLWLVVPFVLLAVSIAFALR